MVLKAEGMRIKVTAVVLAPKHCTCYSPRLTTVPDITYSPRTDGVLVPHSDSYKVESDSLCADRP